MSTEDYLYENLLRWNKRAERILGEMQPGKKNGRELLLMPGVIGLTVKDGKRAVDLFRSDHRGKLMRQGHGTKTPAERRFDFIQGFIRETVRTPDHDLKNLDTGVHAFLKLYRKVLGRRRLALFGSFTDPDAGTRFVRHKSWDGSVLWRRRISAGLAGQKMPGPFYIFPDQRKGRGGFKSFARSLRGFKPGQRKSDTHRIGTLLFSNDITDLTTSSIIF
jgi:hypothetical protein